MTWVRDADRLPNGHTLLADSNGDRVLEIDENGTVVWSIDMGFPYEAERLGTGDESTGGPSAASISLPSREPDATNRSATGEVASWAPQSIVNGVAYLLPGWVGSIEILAALVLVVTLPVWGVVEWRRRSFDVSLRWPIQFRDR
jgi:hypothetical protein